MNTLSKSAFVIANMHMSKSKSVKEFDIDKFLDSEEGQKYIERGLKSKIITHKEFIKRTDKLRKKYGL